MFQTVFVNKNFYNFWEPTTKETKKISLQQNKINIQDNFWIYGF